MDPSSKPIPGLKSSFLRSQIRLLSAILQPSSTWRSSAEGAYQTEDNDDNATASSPPPHADLPQRTIDSVLRKLNTHLSSHNRAAYSQQTQHYIAEQINALYWSNITQQGLYPPQPDEVAVCRDVDLSTLEGVDVLPAGYSDLFLRRAETHVGNDDAGDVGGGNGDGAGSGLLHERDAVARRYDALRARLQAAVVEQRRQRARLESYRQLQSLLVPFENARESVQPNLPGKEGELGRELDRLRILVATFTERMGEVGGSGEGEVEKDGRGEAVREGRQERDKLGDVMDVL